MLSTNSRLASSTVASTMSHKAFARMISSCGWPVRVGRSAEKGKDRREIELSAIVGDFLRGELVAEATEWKAKLFHPGFRIRVEGARHFHAGLGQVEFGLNAPEKTGDPRLFVEHVSAGPTPAIAILLRVVRQDEVFANKPVVFRALDPDRVDSAENAAKRGDASLGLIRQNKHARCAVSVLRQLGHILQQSDLAPDQKRRIV